MEQSWQGARYCRYGQGADMTPFGAWGCGHAEASNPPVPLPWTMPKQPGVPHTAISLESTIPCSKPVSARVRTQGSHSAQILTTKDEGWVRRNQDMDCSRLRGHGGGDRRDPLGTHRAQIVACVAGSMGTRPVVTKIFLG